MTGEITVLMWRRYEGPACDIDINECVRGTAGCAANAGCTNSNGSFSCACWYGYSGECSTPLSCTAVRCCNPRGATYVTAADCA